MTFIELVVTSLTNPKDRELLVAYLSEIGFDGFLEEEWSFKAYISETCFDKDKTDQILIKSGISEINQVKYNLIQEQNWNELWEKSFQPVDVDGKCIIKASFHDADTNHYEYVIHIDPKMSFGTGHHETTSLMISFINELDISGYQVADIGCGTGILSIFAKMKKAESVDAVDTDNWSVINTKENIEKNKLSGIHVFKGDVSLLKGKKYRLVIANINKNVIISQLSQYADLLSEDGILLLSGFYSEDYQTIKLEAEKYFLLPLRFKEKNNWYSVLLKKVSV